MFLTKIWYFYYCLLHKIWIRKYKIYFQTHSTERDADENESYTCSKNVSANATDKCKNIEDDCKKCRSNGTVKNNDNDNKPTNSHGSFTSSFGNKPKSNPPDGNIAKETSQSEQLSDCGYGTQVSQENQESISTSSNDDESPKQKPVHQKPPSTNQKQRFNAAQKQRNVQSSQDKKDIRRKKLVKRSKSSMWVLLYLFITNESIISYKLNFTE